MSIGPVAVDTECPPTTTAARIALVVAVLAAVAACGGGDGGASTPPSSPSTSSPFTLGGTVSGLAGSGLSLLNNGSNNLAVSANGNFTFATPVANGALYNVSVASQPTAPAQTCVVANGTGTVAGANITNVTITCTTNAYSVGAFISGLTGSGLSLSLNGSTHPITANGDFTFPTSVASGASYTVTVAAQPTNPLQICIVENGSGTISSSNITGIRIQCAPAAGTIGGTLTGLRGTGLELTNSNGERIALSANGSFTFATSFAAGGSYAVTVSRQPQSPRQLCAVTNGSGTVTDAAITSVRVDCALRPGNLRTFIPAPTYASNSGELATFTSLNGARSGGHFGLLAQSSALDAAARAHADYLAAHFYAGGRFDRTALSAVTPSSDIAAHAEQQGNARFAGVSPADRARAAGYAWIAGAEAAVFNVGGASRDCSDQIMGSVVLRQRTMNTEMRDMGVGIVNTADGRGFVCVVLVGYADFRGEAPGGWVGVFPFDTAAQISLAMSSDITGDMFGRTRGAPIMFMADRDAPLSLTITLRRASTNAVVATQMVTNATLPNDISANQVFAVPATYLEPNTTYSVHAVGTVESLPVDQTSEFTTGLRSRGAPFTPSSAPRAFRAVYAYPTDRQVSAEYRGAIQNAFEHLQGWYQQQLGGETFAIYAAQPQVCTLPQPSSYYLDNTWTKVQTDLQSCAPVRFGDPDYDWIVYADVNHGCNLPGRLGAGTNTLAILPRADLEGLMGRDTGIDDCGFQFPQFPSTRFIGGLGHEGGHTLDLPHPPGCETGQAGCDSSSLMWQGVYSYPSTYFSETERASLRAHRFINVQRFGR